MAEYLWPHNLVGEPGRLRIMSDLLDPSSRFHLQRIGVGPGWRCLEIGAGNGSLSQWLATRVGPKGVAIATDIRPDLLANLSGPIWSRAPLMWSPRNRRMVLLTSS